MHRPLKRLILGAALILTSVFLAVLPAQSASATATLSGFSPASGPIAQAVTITGSGFVSGQTTVNFNGANAFLGPVTSTTVVAYVPVSATSGPITVTVAGTPTTSTSSFTVTPGVYGASTGSPGSSGIYYGSAFAHYSQITLTALSPTLGSTKVGYTTSDANGNWSATVALPATMPSGLYTLVAADSGGTAASRSLTVQANFPQVGFSGHDRGFQPFESLLGPSNVASMDADWSTTEAGSGNDVLADVVNGGYLYYVDESTNTLHQLNAATGATGFSVPVDATTPANPPPATPVVVNGNVIVASTTNYLLAVNGVTGARVFKVLCGDCGAATFVPSAIASANGIVYVGDSAGAVHAFNAGNGSASTHATSFCTHPVVGISVQGSELSWTDKAGCLSVQGGYTFSSTGHGSTQPTIINGQTCVTNPGTSVECLGGFTANTTASFNPESVPAGDGGLIFVGTATGLAALDSSGNVVWQTPVPHSAGVAVQPVIANGVVYVLDSSLHVDAFSEYGSLLSSTYVNACEFSNVGGNLIVANGVVYASCLYAVEAIDLAGGTR